MPLGKISVSDGRPPEEPSLYGVAQCLTGETSVDRIDMATGGLTRIETLGVPEGMRCVVNTPGSNRIYGLAPGGIIGAAAFYDLTMHYFRDSGYDNVAVAGTLGNSAAFLHHEDGRLVLMELNMTRTNVAPVPSSWMLPSDIVPEMLGENPFVTVYGGYLLLAAHTAPDTYTPLVLTGLFGEGYAVKTGDAEQADAMVPFGVLDKGPDGETYYAVGGYAVAKDGVTELRLYNPVSMEFDRTLATVQGHRPLDSRPPCRGKDQGDIHALHPRGRWKPDMGVRHGVRLGEGVERGCPLFRDRAGTIARPGFRPDKNGMQARIFSGLVSSCTNFAYFYTPKPNRLCR